MATFPKVRAGQPFKPSASLENHVREMVNSTFTISGRRVDKISSSVRINVYNCSDTVLPVGCAVVFTSIASLGEGDVIPCLAIADVDSVWGVLASTLEPNEIGSCIVSGPVKVKIDNGEGDFVQPDPNNPGVFVLSSKGVPVIFKHNGEAIINLGGGSSSELSHQFKIMASDTNAITVLNGNAPNSSVAGTLNGVDYLTTEFTFPVTDATYYIYAVDGKIYALKHRFHSDLIPALLIGVVTVAGGMVAIEQRNFEDNPTVDVLGAVNGAVTLNYTLNYANYTLTSSYTASAKMAVNDTIIELSATAIPANTNGKLTGYIESLTVPFNTSPVAGIVFGNAPDNAEWTSLILNYKYNSEEFRVLSFMENPWNFTFSRFPLNAVEAGE